MRWFEPKTPQEREALVEKGLKSQVFNVCWNCGDGGHNRVTLYRTGISEGRTVYGCQYHRGLIGQTQ